MTGIWLRTSSSLGKGRQASTTEVPCRTSADHVGSATVPPPSPQARSPSGSALTGTPGQVQIALGGRDREGGREGSWEAAAVKGDVELRQQVVLRVRTGRPLAVAVARLGVGPGWSVGRHARREPRSGSRSCREPPTPPELETVSAGLPASRGALVLCRRREHREPLLHPCAPLGAVGGAE